MIKSELNEIKKQFTPKKCSINRYAGCYVDGEKKIKATFSDSFYSVPEDETFKYFDIIKKVLSGTIGKTALNMDFPLSSEQSGGTQELLLRLRDSELKNGEILDEFYERVIENLDYAGNYLILLIADKYDVPVKTSDKATNDASDEVFSYVVCCICPVEHEKGGLYFDENTGKFKKKETVPMVCMPVSGFLFPAFNDRSSDIHSVMYYVKKAEDVYPEFIKNVLGTEYQLTAEGQKQAFHTMISDTFGGRNDFGIVQDINAGILEAESDYALTENAEPLVLEKRDIGNILTKAGASKEQIDTFNQSYDELVGTSGKLLAKNLHNEKAIEVKSPNVIVKVKPECSELVQAKTIDGIRCIVIEMSDSVEVDGLDVKI